LEAGCSVIIKKGLPKKSKDPRSFNLPMSIRALSVDKALMDLGASINLIPMVMMKKISDLEIKPTKMMLQLAEKSIKSILMVWLKMCILRWINSYFL